jgi:hypothetical protein
LGEPVSGHAGREDVVAGGKEVHGQAQNKPIPKGAGFKIEKINKLNKKKSFSRGRSSRW